MHRITSINKVGKIPILLSLLMLGLLTPHKNIAQSLSEAISRIIRLDTEMNSTIDALHYSVIYQDSTYTESLSLKAEPRVAMDSFIMVGNALALFPIYAYISLRKCDSDGTFNKLINTTIGEKLTDSIKNFIFQKTGLPKVPQYGPGSEKLDIYAADVESILVLMSQQKRLDYCTYSVFNSLIAIHHLGEYSPPEELGTSAGYPDQKTFAEAKTGKLNFNLLSKMTAAIVENFNLLERNTCKTAIEFYTMDKGFYHTQLKQKDIYIMTGVNKTGRVFIGIVPSTMTAVCLLSEGKDNEVVDLGILILKLINNQWK